MSAFTDHVTIEITREAADALAWFIDHGEYGETLTDVILDHVREWAARDRTTLDDMDTGGAFAEYCEG